VDDLSTVTKPKEYIMKFDHWSDDAFGQVDDAGIPKGARWRKDRSAAARAAAMLAFAAGLLVAPFRAGAHEPAGPEPTPERAGADSAHAQPTVKRLAPPKQSDVSDSDARTLDALYRVLIARPLATSSGSRSGALPLGGAKR
jgi:hypothetical protein